MKDNTESSFNIAYTKLDAEFLAMPDEIARVLNEIIRQHNIAEDSEDRLLIFIDGIDEVTEGESSFIDILPSHVCLENGIYIVLTSRPKEELAAGTNVKVHSMIEESIDGTEKYIVDAQNRLDSKWTKQIRTIVNNRSVNGSFTKEEIRFLEILFTENYLMNMHKLRTELAAEDYIKLFEGLEGSSRSNLPENLERFYLSILSEIERLEDNREKSIVTVFFISLLDVNDRMIKESQLDEKSRRIHTSIEDQYSKSRSIYYFAMQEADKQRAQSKDAIYNNYYQLAMHILFGASMMKHMK